ncbi:hypothetical protein [Zavarzinella formosa]|uniref:hypothetical protein n=1 Tax=Zavarzinella formosa TaxID=360055 RepID=UPI00031C2EA8|nr:hypothetical protein [Zavarzinella formosa]
MIAIIKRRWNRWAVAVVVGLALTGPLSAQSPPPIHTKNATLRLPVQIDERTRPQVAEVKLYVRPLNGNWQCVQTLPPTAGAFDFKATADGTYAFTFVTVDRRGKSEPANLDAVPPHRIVVVDTTPPEVSAQPIPLKGEKFLQVHVRDQNPDWASLRVMYLAPDQSWQPLTVAAADTPTVFRVPNAGVFESKIRVFAADRAGNSTNRDLDLGDPTANFGFGAKSTVSQGKPDPALIPNTDPTPDIKSPAMDIRPPMIDSLPPIRAVDYQEPIKPPTPLKAPESVKSPVIYNGPRELPPIPEVPPLRSNDLPVIRNGNQNTDIKIPDVPAVLPPSVSAKEDLRIDLPSVTPPPSVMQTTSAMKPIDVPQPANIPKTEMPRDIVVPTPPPIPEPVFEAKGPPTHTILNSRTCTINYQVEGARGNNRIDFWATGDGGKTWIALRDDAGGLPPAKLTLPADGYYGIRIRPGAGSKPPEAGEDPDCVVEIDSTKPTVNLMQPSLGTGSDEGTMLITWTASDKNLLSNSVNLSYATKPDGPWEVIVSGYKNAGLYRWTMPSHLSGNVYVRLEVSDRAGNIGQHDLKSPVALETLKPRVKVLGVGASR